jgi:hypothetical protein
MTGILDSERESGKSTQTDPENPPAAAFGPSRTSDASPSCFLLARSSLTLGQMR